MNFSRSSLDDAAAFLDPSLKEEKDQPVIILPTPINSPYLFDPGATELERVPSIGGRRRHICQNFAKNAREWVVGAKMTRLLYSAMPQSSS